MRIVVLVKQVADPLLPVSDLAISPGGTKVLGPANVPPVVNGYDEQALEAALRIRDTGRGECEIIALSAGSGFAIDVLQRSLTEADDLVLIEDDSLDTPDSSLISRALAAAIGRLGAVDLVLCGRQASDWDHGQVPLSLAELLGWPCATLARQVTVDDDIVTVERVLSDRYQVMRCELPAVVTVTSELGELRYPTMQARLQARTRRPRRLSLSDLHPVGNHDGGSVLMGLSLQQETRDCTLIDGKDGAEAGRRLASVLIESGFVAGSQGAT